MPTMDFLHPSLTILTRKAAKAGMKKVDGFWAYTNSEKDGDVLGVVLITLKFFNPVHVACLVKQSHRAINWSEANVAQNITNIQRASHSHAR